MKKIEKNKVVEAVKNSCIEMNYNVDMAVLDALKTSALKEESDVGRDVLAQIIANDELAMETKVPMCQDTGLVVVFMEVGRDLRLEYDLEEAIQEGVRRGYADGYLRKSMVKHPLDRVNTGDNTPCVIHTKLVEGDRLKLELCAKGGGSENMSLVKMLKPADGIVGVKALVLETILHAGGNPCPPITIGVGLGGSFEKAALLAKKALMRPLDDKSPIPINAKLEEELLELVNKSGVGPMGMGGRITAIGVKVESYPCHIASLPVAININCHASRHQTVIL